MIEVKKNELRVDADVLKCATDEEMLVLRNIAETIAKRVKEGGVRA